MILPATGTTQWFVILSGKHAGRWHLAGWSLSAHLGTSSGPRDDGWLGFASCPRCHAMVLNQDRDGGVSPQMFAHEDWHHRTDYPHPEDQR